MLNTMTLATFAPLVGQTFEADFTPTAPTPITLVEAVALTNDEDARRQRVPFRLVFEAPTGSPRSQAIYTLRTDPIGSLDLFLVPIAATGTVITYEAIFT